MGKNALLANVNGRFSKFITAIGVSILVDLMLIAINREDKPTQIRNRNANTPSMLSGVKAKPTWNPSGIAISRIIEAWNIDRSVAEKIVRRSLTYGRRLSGGA